jgi:hypothetical protein
MTGEKLSALTARVPALRDLKSLLLVTHQQFHFKI